MSPPTLISMVQRACARNIPSMQDVGDMSYELVRPILKQIDNPQQLRNIEIASPHIADQDAELWKAFIARDILQWEEKIIEPKNPASWWKVYRKLIREEERAKEEQEAQLRATMMGITKQKQENQTQFVPKVIHQDVKSKAFAYGVPNSRAGSSGQIKTPTLQNAKTGDQVLRALRKQSAVATRQKGLSSTVFQPAKTMLPNARIQIAKPPQAMVREYAKPVPLAVARNKAQAEGRETKPAAQIFAPRQRTTVQDRSLSNALREEQAKKEARLRALTGVKPAAASPSSTTTSEPAPASATVPRSPPAPTRSPPRVESLTPLASPRAALAVADETRKRLSPSPVPMMRKRPATPASIFMPSKKKKI